MAVQKLKVSAPGRICLFGEHQDYLKLPVITAAINLRIEIEGKKRDDDEFHFDFPDINRRDSFKLTQQIEYVKERDYLRSVVNVLMRHNVKFQFGYDCVIRGKIPINSGTSSSSAMIVAWIKFLLTIAEDERSNNYKEIAWLAHLSEVAEFNEPGGMMDHYATSLGGVLFIDFQKEIKVEKLDVELGNFILGDSCESKNTKGILGRVKGGINEILNSIKNNEDEVDLKKIQFSDTLSKLKKFPKDQILIFEGALQNRDITIQAYQLFQQQKMDFQKLGQLLNKTQDILRDKLIISTPKLDRMLTAAINAGATGGKLNGSGGGGCMFVNAPQNPEKVAAAIKNTHSKPYVIQVDKGVRLDYIEKD